MKVLPSSDALLVVYISMVTCAHGNTIVTNRWSRLLGNNLTVDAKILMFRSAARCNTACLQRTGCSHYCYDARTGSCRVGGVLTSPTVIMASDPVRCYRYVPPGGCPTSAGYSLYGKNCIKAYTVLKNYTEAGATCAADGGHLYRFKSLYYTSAYKNLVFGPLLGKAWLGGDALNPNHQFVWSDGTPVAADLWAPRQPDNVGGNQYCVCHWSDIRLNDCDSYFTQGFVCQID